MVGGASLKSALKCRHPKPFGRGLSAGFWSFAQVAPFSFPLCATILSDGLRLIMRPRLFPAFMLFDGCCSTNAQRDTVVPSVSTTGTVNDSNHDLSQNYCRLYRHASRFLEEHWIISPLADQPLQAFLRMARSTLMEAIPTSPTIIQLSTTLFQATTPWV